MKEKQLYIEPEVSVLEIAAEAIICQSLPGETPDDITNGGWI